MGTNITIIECEATLINVENQVRRKASNRSRFPVFILSLTLTQVLIFVYIQTIDANIVSALCYSRNHKKEIWRLITYILVHTTIPHLLINVMIQLLFGLFLELEQGKLKTIIIILSGGIAGILGTEFFTPNYRSIIGSSASCYALLTAHIPHLLLNRENLKVSNYRLFILISIIIGEVVTYFPDVKNFLTSFICESLVSSSRKTIVCSTSHLAGAFVGFFMAIIVFYYEKPKHKAGFNSFLMCVKHLSNTLLSFCAGITIYSYMKVAFSA